MLAFRQPPQAFSNRKFLRKGAVPRAAHGGCRMCPTGCEDRPKPAVLQKRQCAAGHIHRISHAAGPLLGRRIVAICFWTIAAGRRCIIAVAVAAGTAAGAAAAAGAGRALAVPVVLTRPAVLTPHLFTQSLPGFHHWGEMGGGGL